MTDRDEVQLCDGDQDSHPPSSVHLSPVMTDSEPSDDEDEKESDNNEDGLASALASASADDSATVLSHMLDKGMEEVTMKYVTEQISFEEYSSMLAQQVKTEPVDEPELGLAQEEVTTDAEKTATAADDVAVPSVSQSPKAQRKPHSKLPRHLQGLMGEANMKFARGEMQEAIKMCMEIVRLTRARAPEPFQTLALIYEESGESSKSLQCSLIAALLQPNDPEEWVRLAGIYLEQDDVQQAAVCYGKALKYDAKNVSLWWASCDLHEKLGQKKKAVDGYLQILNLLSPDSGEKFFQVTRELSKNYHSSGEPKKALESLSKAFELHSKYVTAEDVNLLLELLMSQHTFDSPVEVLVQHCGVQLQYANGTELAATPGQPHFKLPLANDIPTRCIVPEEIPVDLRSKLAVCMIHLSWVSPVQEVIGPLLAEQPDDVGDLYLDVAEAFVDCNYNREAEKILSQLLASSVYKEYAAVWLRYAECLTSLGELQSAVMAYRKVIELAPDQLKARVSLSALQQQLGRHEEALQVLEQERPVAYDDKQQPKLDLGLMLPKCLLLFSQKKYTEFYECSKQVLFSYFKDIFEKKHLSIIMASRSMRHRKAAMKSIMHSKFEESVQTASSVLEESAITTDDLWDLYKKVSTVLVELKMFAELQDVSALALASPLFMADPELASEADFMCMLACLLNGNAQFAYAFVKGLCVKNMNKNQPWNLLCQVIAISTDFRHNRFCLRLMNKYPEHYALGILNGHNALVSGSYKHCLGEYMAAFKQHPEDPLLSLCVGLTFVHMATQKFAGKKHALIIQACTFLNHYVERRGECQESYYNLGRAMHQLGLLHVASHYYEQALKFPPAVPDQDKEIFDLSREIAFNLRIIYQNSGSHELAAMVTQKYLVI